MKDKSKNKKIIYTIIGIISVVLVAIAITYAFWLVSKSQTEKNIISSGCLDITLTNEMNDIKLLDTEPITDAEGKKLVPYEFTVTNTCEGVVNYEISLETFQSSSTMQDSSIRVMVDEDESTILSANKEIDPTIEGATKSYVLKTGSLSTKETTGATESHKLRIWIDYDAPMSEIGKTFESKVSVSVGQKILNPKLCQAVTEKTVTTGNIPTGEYNNGDEYICEVMDDVFYHFFIISKNDDDSVNLIMDRNVAADGYAATEANTGTVEWISLADYTAKNQYEMDMGTEDAADPTLYCSNNSNVCVEEGPITLVRAMYNYLQNWNTKESNYRDLHAEVYLNPSPGVLETPDYDNLSNELQEAMNAGYRLSEVLNYLYQPDENGNRQIAKPALKARIMTVPEALANGCKMEINTTVNGVTEKTNVYPDSCPLYLVNHLQHKDGYVPGSYSVNADKVVHVNGIRTYWLLNGLAQTGYLIHDNGSINSKYTTTTNYGGIRPVITVDLIDFDI